MRSMQKANPNEAALGDLTRMFEQFRMPAVDLQALLDTQRKDLEALAQATRQAYDGIRSLVARRDEILTESISQWQEAVRANGGKGLTEQAEQLQQGMAKAIADLRELGQIEARTRTEVWKTVQERMQQNFAEMQKLLTPR
ncbi:MAG: phasin family protein [Burkholderiaceae bacterium]